MVVCRKSTVEIGFTVLGPHAENAHAGKYLMHVMNLLDLFIPLLRGCLYPDGAP